MSPNQSAERGHLYIVATPIGNLGDISARALELLQTVDAIAAEDTRHTRKLLQYFGIDTPLFALHDFNERARVDTIIGRLAEGERLALVSDAGTPLISDPGFVLVRAAREHGIPVVPIPGPCAIITALSAAGLPTDRFCFEGFLPAKRKARRDVLEALRKETRTLVFYESPHRIRETLAEAAVVFGEQRQAVLARELTKTFETFLCGPLASLCETLAIDENAGRGEIVLMIAGAEKDDDATEAGSVDTQRLLAALVPEVGVKKAARIVADVTGQAKNVLYQQALALGKDS